MLVSGAFRENANTSGVHQRRNPTLHIAHHAIKVHPKQLSTT